MSRARGLGSAFKMFGGLGPDSAAGAGTTIELDLLWDTEVCPEGTAVIHRSTQGPPILKIETVQPAARACCQGTGKRDCGQLQLPADYLEGYLNGPIRPHQQLCQLSLKVHTDQAAPECFPLAACMFGAACPDSLNMVFMPVQCASCACSPTASSNLESSPMLICASCMAPDVPTRQQLITRPLDWGIRWMCPHGGCHPPDMEIQSVFYALLSSRHF